MAFTIEVAKRERTEEFSFKDLMLSHDECYGGKIRIKRGAEEDEEEQERIFELVCRRCGDTAQISVGEEGTILIIRTAIDGKEKKSYEADGKTEVSVIQKTST